uniref:AF4/FMR2 C-terminal homology domain-containing protein n=1 Tax=Mola mola TaxID=94237 RepID=A0A3Q4B5W1_MOLML
MTGYSKWGQDQKNQIESLSSLCPSSHLESERSALKRREWERRNQEVQQDEDLFSTGFNLFGEPYKTNKGDALASRVQNTLGSYEEMKDLLTSHTNQSHLVGIPKGSNNLQTLTPSTIERPAMDASSSSTTSMQPPASTTSSSSAITISHQSSKKSRSSIDWSRSGHGQSAQGTGLITVSHLSHPSSPLASTSVLTTPTPGLTTPTSGLTTPTFPPGKPIAVQQKPTAYVRPMDGQDQAPSDSPQLKPPLVATEGFNNSQPYAGNSGNVKNKLPKLSLSHAGEVSLPNDSSCVEEILREMTHSWPPPLTAIHTPGKADQTKFPIPNKVSVCIYNCSYDRIECHKLPRQKYFSQHGNSEVVQMTYLQTALKALVNLFIYALQLKAPSPLFSKQDKRKHRGQNTRITPKSREFIETDSSSSSSECQSDSEEALKIPSPMSSVSNGSSSSCNSLSISNISGSFGTSVPDPGGLGGQCNDMKTMSPPSTVGHEVPLSPLREYQEIQSLWVKIDLSLLSRVPGQGLGDRSRAGITEGRDRERLGERMVVAERERQRQEEREWPGRICVCAYVFNSTLNRKQSRRCDEKLLPPLLSPLSDDPPRRRTGDSSSSLSKEGGPSGMLPCSISSHKYRRGEGKAAAHVRNGIVSAQEFYYMLPLQVRYKTFFEQRVSANKLFMFSFHCTVPRVHTADYYMQEAKRLKHKADALMDKFGKAVNYADGGLSFIECGNAMERDPLEAKSPYTMYSETVELIRYAMRLKNFTSHSATIAEKKLAVLCNRCLSLLYLRMFHLKKDHAVKYSRSLIEYFKENLAQTYSPILSLLSRVNGTPSPISLSPSPASSGGGGAGGGSGGVPSSSGSVAIPQRIHHMAASHVNITNNILRSYEHWETADRLASDSQEFFQELDSVMEPLNQQSSMTELVRYIRQGLHWLRIEARLL